MENENKEVKKVEVSKKEMFECTNCSWEGTERAMSCKTKGELTKDGVHLGGKRCSNCGYLDNMCPVCGDSTGKAGSRLARMKKEAEETAIKASEFNGGAVL